MIATLAECHRLAKHSEERCLAYTAAIDALDDHGTDAATVTRDLTHPLGTPSQTSRRHCNSVGVYATYGRRFSSG